MVCCSLRYQYLKWVIPENTNNLPQAASWNSLGKGVLWPGIQKPCEGEFKSGIAKAWRRGLNLSSGFP